LHIYKCNQKNQNIEICKQVKLIAYEICSNFRDLRITCEAYNNHENEKSVSIFNAHKEKEMNSMIQKRRGSYIDSIVDENTFHEIYSSDFDPPVKTQSLGQ
jgi:hypothetical protein